MNNISTHQVPLTGLRRIRKHSVEIASILLIVFTQFTTGCYQKFYRYNLVVPVEADYEQMQSENKYFILHNQDSVWHFKNLILNQEKNQLSGIVEPLPPDHMFYKKTKSGSSTSYRKSTGDPIHEVHLYTHGNFNVPPAELTIPGDSIYLIEVYQKDTAATETSTTLSTLGVIAVVGIIVTIIVAASTFSIPMQWGYCPSVYTGDGAERNFAGKIFPGANYPGLERDDYIPLNDYSATATQLQVIVANAHPEIQYINQANLLMVQHPANTSVGIDQKGKFHTIQFPMAPLKAVSNTGKSYQQILRSKDSSGFAFNDDTTSDQNLRSLTLSFANPEGSQSCKLILNSKNSFWLEYITEKMHEQYGTTWVDYYGKQKSASAKSRVEWEQKAGIPLSVYVETQKGWTFVDYFNVTGSAMSRDLIMPLDISGTKGDEVNIRLACGFMFWEVDYAAVDFSEDMPIAVQNIQPVSVLDTQGKDVSALLTASDHAYYIMPDQGSELTFTYPGIARQQNDRQSFFFHGSGYYDLIRDYKGDPNMTFIKTIEKPGAFELFSSTQFNELSKQTSTLYWE